MLHHELYLAALLERLAIERERAAAGRLAHPPGRRHRIRFRIGASLMRLGGRIAGEATASPAWQR